jgi:hypothetical protein
MGTSTVAVSKKIKSKEYIEDDFSSTSSEDDEGKKDDKKTKKQKKTKSLQKEGIKGFTDAEIRRFVYFSTNMDHDTSLTISGL